jgi:hypothetical protein
MRSRMVALLLHHHILEGVDKNGIVGGVEVMRRATLCRRTLQATISGPPVASGRLKGCQTEQRESSGINYGPATERGQ